MTETPTAPEDFDKHVDEALSFDSSRPSTSNDDPTEDILNAAKRSVDIPITGPTQSENEPVNIPVHRQHIRKIAQRAAITTGAVVASAAAGVGVGLAIGDAVDTRLDYNDQISKDAGDRAEQGLIDEDNKSIVIEVPPEE